MVKWGALHGREGEQSPVKGVAALQLMARRGNTGLLRNGNQGFGFFWCV